MTDEKISDCWQTPLDLFDELNKEFNFDIDLCATKDSSKKSLYGVDYLNDIFSDIHNNQVNYRGQFVQFSAIYDIEAAFMNPPYSNPKPFIEKAWEDSKHCKIVLLVKCDPSTRWWATFWNYDITGFYCYKCNSKFPDEYIPNQCESCGDGEYNRRVYKTNGPKPGCEVRFFPKRIKFDPPQQLIENGEVWYLESDCRRGTKSGKWVQRCSNCVTWCSPNSIQYTGCTNCKGKGYKELSGPTFPCALLIFDRRGL